MTTKHDNRFPILLGNSDKKQLKKEARRMVREAQRETKLWQAFFSTKF